MSDCPVVRFATNLKLLKKFEQVGRVAIPITDWVYFFEALNFLSSDGGHTEMYCAIGSRHLYLSKTPIERKVKREPVQSELFER